MSAVAMAEEASALFYNFLTATFLRLPFFHEISSSYMQSLLERKLSYKATGMALTIRDAESAAT